MKVFTDATTTSRMGVMNHTTRNPIIQLHCGRKLSCSNNTRSDLTVALVFQGHRSSELPVDLQSIRARGEDRRLWDGSRHLQVQCQHSSPTDVRQQERSRPGASFIGIFFDAQMNMRSFLTVTSQAVHSPC